MLVRTSLLAFLGSVICAAGCKHRASVGAETESLLDAKQKGGSARVSSQALKLWRVMRIEATLGEVQASCEPLRFSPPASVPHRGTVFLLHGFTACPQQFDELGPKLAAAGYEVFVPLFPGHGAILTSTKPRVDNTSQVPRSTAGWVRFTSRVNEFASLMEGKKVIIGLSQGANLALHASQISPTLYDKVVAIAPMLSVQFEQFTNIFSNSISVLNVDEFLLAQRNGWPKCETDAGPPANRAGFCNFENRNAITVVEFGKMVADLAKKQASNRIKTKAPVQLVISHMNNGVSNDASEELVRNMNVAGSVAKLCIMPKEVPHSMFSIHDSPYVKPWNAALFQSIEGFVTKGTFISGSTGSITDCDIKY